MGALIEGKVFPCPKCGLNRWLMEVPEDVAREEHARRAEDTPGKAYRRGVAMGAIISMGGVLGRIAFWRTLMHPEGPAEVSPSREGDVVCANCGHQMGMTQGPRENHDWSLGS